MSATSPTEFSVTPPIIKALDEFEGSGYTAYGLQSHMYDFLDRLERLQNSKTDGPPPASAAAHLASLASLIGSATPSIVSVLAALGDAGWLDLTKGTLVSHLPSYHGIITMANGCVITFLTGLLGEPSGKEDLPISWLESGLVAAIPGSSAKNAAHSDLGCVLGVFGMAVGTLTIVQGVAGKNPIHVAAGAAGLASGTAMVTTFCG